ncbi:MAG TPA: hypothetical protein VIT00_03870, partial [Terrimicrobiaceae bacterium]
MTDVLLIPFWNSCPAPNDRLLGVDFHDRIALQSRRSGFKKILTRLGPDEVQDLPEQFLLLSPDLLLSDAAWKRLMALEPERETLTTAEETDSFALVRCADAKFLRQAFQESDSYA